MTEQGAASSTRRPRLSDFVDELFEFVDGVIPPETVRHHFRNSRIEFWKGIRALIDVRIDRLDRKNEPRKGAAVTVE
ncbi:MAG TPA: hypothetical protein VHD76_22190 [Bryobacteraceae bacterium]|jgi:hypothetical protein|nr:hypothetical protein [Bryobacteraceae bacterium]